MPPVEVDALLATALSAARDAVAIHRTYLGAVPFEDWSSKGLSDFVTHVDREAEAAIVRRIHAAYPQHLIEAEEADWPAPAPLDGEPVTWTIDPLDGTTNYLHGYPAYAASVAARRGAELLAGVVVHGATGQSWYATAGGGAFLDGERIRVSGIGELAHALIGTGFPFKALDRLPEYTRQFDHVLRR
jgi:myo-inositol-1(or 4)-monophosphatase